MIRTTKIYANGGRYGKKKGDAFHGTWNFNTGSVVIIVKVIPQSIRNSQENTKTEQSQEASEKKTKKKDKNIEQAKLLAMGYDYDGAINLLKSVKNYKENTKITKLIKKV